MCVRVCHVVRVTASGGCNCSVRVEFKHETESWTSGEKCFDQVCELVLECMFVVLEKTLESASKPEAERCREGTTATRVSLE